MIDPESFENELSVQDRVLVEAQMYGRPVSFRAVIARICPAELWLGLASPDGRIEAVSPDQRVRLTVARAGAALLGQSRFLRPLGGSRSRVFAVDRPTLLERVQRRDYVRYPMDLPLRFRHVDPATWEPRGRVARTVTRNVSPGGLLFVSDDEVKVGDDLDMTLPLSAWERVSVNGVVRRLARVVDEGEPRPNGGPNGQYGPYVRPARAEVAVKFTRITSLDQDRIVRLILLAEHRRREAAMRSQAAPAS